MDGKPSAAFGAEGVEPFANTKTFARRKRRARERSDQQLPLLFRVRHPSGSLQRQLNFIVQHGRR